MKHDLFSVGLWFDSEAEEAARFYASIFPNSSLGDITHYGSAGNEIHKQPEGKVMTATVRIAELEFICLNGGPLFKMNPSISFFIVLESEEEVNNLWKNLEQDGKVLMEFGKYPWSERYGWVADRYGLTWQVALGKISEVGQQVTPSLLFTGKQFGRAEEAMKFYTSIFDNSRIVGIMKNEQGGKDVEGTVVHAQFTLNGTHFMVMDSNEEHKFNFNEAVSLVVNCDTQEEIDRYWSALSRDGKESECGWVYDQFVVSWQVSPVRLEEMLKSPDKQKRERVTNAFLKMKKFDLAKLEQAFEG